MSLFTKLHFNALLSSYCDLKYLVLTLLLLQKKKIVWSWISMLEGLTSFKKKKSIWHRISTDVAITSKNTISPGVANCLPESQEITKPKFQFTVNSNISHFWLHVKKKIFSIYFIARTSGELFHWFHGYKQFT